MLKVIHAGDAVSAVRVASLRQFKVNAAHLRTAFANAGDTVDAEKELATVEGGGEVLSALSEARRLLRSADNKAVAAIAIVERCFVLPPVESRKAFAEFVQCWEKKPQALSGNGTLSEFLNYLELFMDAGGKVCRPDVDEDGTPDKLLLESGKEKSSGVPADAVHLMTAHAAKGLEFPVVCVIRVASPSFPVSYKEDLVEFPKALRNRGNVPEEDDPKDLHEEEERRLFYVAVTRAEDELILCGKLGGKKNPAPAGYLRELVNRSPGPLAGIIEFREVPEGTVIGAIHASATPHPQVHDWVAIPPLDTTRILRLSPSAIDNYNTCPLRYKLKRDWNLPEEPAAAMQFGQAIHTALMGYFDAQRKGKSVDAETVIASFLDEFAKAKIEEPLQRELYEKNGRRQLLAFLNSPAATPCGKVAKIEYHIDMEIAGIQVSGRIDRVDESDEGLTVIDYKTGRPKTEEHAKKSLQLSVYALAMQKLGGVKAVVFENLEDRTTVATTRTSAALAKAEATIAEVAASIRAGKFDATPGFHCNWCAYQMLCPEKELVTISASAAVTAAN